MAPEEKKDFTFTPPTDAVRSAEDISLDTLRHTHAHTAEKADTKASPDQKPGQKRLQSLSKRQKKAHHKLAYAIPRQNETLTRGEVFTMIMIAIILFSVGVFSGFQMGDSIGRINKECRAPAGEAV